MGDNDSNQSTKPPFKKIIDSFKVLGASLTGITAIFTAVGFLVERARLFMLGLPSTTFDLEQYVETGSRFLALLPILLGEALLSAIKALLSAIAIEIWMALLLLALAGSIAVYWLSRSPLPRLKHMRQQSIQAWDNVVQGWHNLWRYVRQHTLVILLPLVIFQYCGAHESAQALNIRDMLFGSDILHKQNLCASLPSSVPEVEVMKCRLRQENVAVHNQYVGGLFLTALLGGLVLYYVLKNLGGGRARFWENGLAIASTLLLISQITLLPVNFGILLTINRFPEVCVRLTTPQEAQPERPPDERIVLMRETEKGLYLFSRTEQKMWYVLRGEAQSIVHYGMVNVLKHDDVESCQSE